MTGIATRWFRRRKQSPAQLHMGHNGCVMRPCPPPAHSSFLRLLHTKPLFFSLWHFSLQPSIRNRKNKKWSWAGTQQILWFGRPITYCKSFLRIALLSNRFFLRKKNRIKTFETCNFYRGKKKHVIFIISYYLCIYDNYVYMN